MPANSRTTILRRKQTNNIIFITFWSQFASYALNSILIIFLTRPLLTNGLGYSQAKAYAFIGISQATGYLMPVLGGYFADNVIGLRRSILLGSLILAAAYLLIMFSGYTIQTHGDFLFIAAYALVPAANSLLMGTASGMVSYIYADDAVEAKSAMTYYYMAINLGALLATIISPALLESRYGPLSVLTLTFLGKSIAAINFSRRYSLYENIIYGKDKMPLSVKTITRLVIYLSSIYGFTLFAYSHIFVASILVSMGCAMGIFFFLGKTLTMDRHARYKQLVASMLIIEAIVFFVIYNQMNTTLVLFAKYNSDLHLLHFVISPAQYQMLNPILIIALGLKLPHFYKKFPSFSIPYQFATGTLLAGFALLILAYASIHAKGGLVNGNYIAVTYLLISLAELWVSAIGLSMIGLYCDAKNLGFAMGVWYLACSLSYALSGRLAAFVAMPESMLSPIKSLPIYQAYYLTLGLIACALGAIMIIMARILNYYSRKRGIVLS